MKKFLILLVLPLLASGQTYKKKPKVLFVGNSYTFVNNLPLLIYNLALAAGDSLVYDSYTVGGYTFKNHFQDAQCLAKINAQNWDYVVLQAQSQEPAFSDQQVMAQTHPYALKLDSVIKANYACSNTVFFETWGRKNGDQINCPNFPPVCTYTGMQNRLRKWYKKFADDCFGAMAPVGEAWRASIAASPTLELFDPDQSHPGINGSYLAACVFYETLFQRSVVSNTYNPGVSAGSFTFLKQTAHNTVHDSLSTWNFGTVLPWAEFAITTAAAGALQFVPQAAGLSHTWYFGDGSSSQAASPTHAYAQAGTYTVAHVSFAGCRKDSVVKTVSWTATGSAEGRLLQLVSLFPNPCGNQLVVTGFAEKTAQFQIYDFSGRIVKSGPLSVPLSLTDLQQGVYFIRVGDNFGQAYGRFVKNE